MTSILLISMVRSVVWSNIKFQFLQPGDFYGFWKDWKDTNNYHIRWTLIKSLVWHNFPIISRWQNVRDILSYPCLKKTIVQLFIEAERHCIPNFQCILLDLNYRGLAFIKCTCWLLIRQLWGTSSLSFKTWLCLSRGFSFEDRSNLFNL